MKQNPNCIFCKIVSGQIPSFQLYEDDTVISFLDAFPISRGHALVIPKNHSEKLHECPPEDLAAVAAASQKVAAALTKTLQAPAYNLLCNTGPEAGQKVFHVHFHLIPRKEGDGILKGWPAAEMDKQQAEKLAKTIRENL